MDEVKDLAEEEDREWETNLARETQAAASGRVTTEVKKSADAKRVDYARQGNKWWLTDQGIRERRALKFSEGVSAYIRDIWALLPKNERKKVEKDTYCAFCRAVAKILTGGGGYDPEEDWRADSHGLGPMAFGLFYDAVFQLVDLWTETSLEADYQDFLRNLVKDMPWIKHLPGGTAAPGVSGAKGAAEDPQQQEGEVAREEHRTPLKSGATGKAEVEATPTSVLERPCSTASSTASGGEACGVCGADDGEATRQCTDCDQCFHAECVGAPPPEAAGGAWQCPECTTDGTGMARCGVCEEEVHAGAEAVCPECHARFHAECLGLAPEDAAGGAAFACPQCVPPGKAVLTIDVAGAPDADGYFQVEIGVTAHEVVAEGLLEVAGSDDLEIVMKLPGLSLPYNKLPTVAEPLRVPALAPGASHTVTCYAKNSFSFRKAARTYIMASLRCLEEEAGAASTSPPAEVAKAVLPLALDPETGQIRRRGRKPKPRRQPRAGRGQATRGPRAAGVRVARLAEGGEPARSKPGRPAGARAAASGRADHDYKADPYQDPAGWGAEEPSGWRLWGQEDDRGYAFVGDGPGRKAERRRLAPRPHTSPAPAPAPAARPTYNPIPRLPGAEHHWAQSGPGVTGYVGQPRGPPARVALRPRTEAGPRPKEPPGGAPRRRPGARYVEFREADGTVRFTLSQVEFAWGPLGEGPTRVGRAGQQLERDRERGVSRLGRSGGRQKN